MFKNFSELQAHMDALEKEFGVLKVNLQFNDGSTEGVWATPADVQSYVVLKDERRQGAPAKVRLFNRALWGGLWGSLITVKTHGAQRPTATIKDQQADDDVTKDLEMLCELYRAHEEQQKEQANGQTACSCAENCSR